MDQTDYFVGYESIGWLPAAHSDYIDDITNSTMPSELAIMMAESYYLSKSTNKYSNGENKTPSTVSVLNMSLLDMVVSRTHDLGNAIVNSSDIIRAQIWSALAGEK